MSIELLPPLFLARETSLREINEAGWRVEHSSGGGWWFRNRETQERQPVPYWIRQMVDDAYAAGQERARAEMRHALGITAKQKKRDPQQMFPCVP